MSKFSSSSQERFSMNPNAPHIVAADVFKDLFKYVNTALVVTAVSSLFLSKPPAPETEAKVPESTPALVPEVPSDTHSSPPTVILDSSPPSSEKTFQRTDFHVDLFPPDDIPNNPGASQGDVGNLVSPVSPARKGPSTNDLRIQYSHPSGDTNGKTGTSVRYTDYIWTPEGRLKMHE